LFSFRKDLFRWAVSGLLCVPSAAWAKQIGINFINQNAGATQVVATDVPAGVVPLDGAYWNQIGFAFGVGALNHTSVLTDSSGQATATLRLSLSQAYVGNSGANATDPAKAGSMAMMAGYISWDVVDGTAPDDTGQLSITALDPGFTGPGYDVYVYFDADVNDRTFTFTLNGQESVPAADAATWSGVFREAALYPSDAHVAVFRNLSASELVLQADSDTGRAAVNAIQIVSRDHPAFDAIRLAFHHGNTTASAMDPASSPITQGTVVNTVDQVWNAVIQDGGDGLVFSDFPLTSSSGLDTGARLDVAAGFSGYNTNGWGDRDKDAVMMEGYYGFRAEEALTVRALPPSITSGGYHVVVYGDAPGMRDMTFTLRTASGEITRLLSDTGTYAEGFSEGRHFVRFTGLEKDAFTLTGNAATTDLRSAITGLEIVAGQPPPVIHEFTADDGYVPAGTAVSLNWRASGFETLTLHPGGLDAAALTTGGTGSVTVEPSQTTTYTLTAVREGLEVTESIRVAVGPERPNILFVLVDDMGWQDTSEPFLFDENGQQVLTPLNQHYRTPSMEALADDGMKFTTAYATPVCTPSRNSWLTGLNSARHHVTNWTTRTGAESGGASGGLNSPTDWLRGGLSDTLPTLPGLLREAGYRTIHAGKAHFGATSFARDPLNIGFDINIAGSEIGQPGSYSGDYGQSTGWPVPDLEAYRNTGTHLTEALTLAMGDAMADAVSDGVPFFAYMAHYALHAPFETDSRFADHYPELSGSLLAYATLIEGMDKSLGDLRARLVELGVAENTLIVFMSDNGGDAPYADVNDSNAPLRHKKGSKYEGGVRVPLMFSWAARNPANRFQQDLPIPANSREDDLVAVFDLFPTFAALAGVTPPDGLDGVDLTPYLEGTPGTHRPQELLIHFPHNHRSDFFSILREGDWKLIYNYIDGSVELYNLAQDLSETTNLAAAEPQRVAVLGRKMARALAAAGAQWPVSTADGSEVPWTAPAMPGLDSDQDGVADELEDVNRNGLLDPGEMDPDHVDTDRDHTPDGAELRTGTNPLDPDSSLRSLSATRLVGWTSYGLPHPAHGTSWSGTRKSGSFPHGDGVFRFEIPAIPVKPWISGGVGSKGALHPVRGAGFLLGLF
jgi:arylsulfatase A-like enzyme